ncbi:MAG: dipeptidase [Spirochaetaceae bacterium]
MIPVIDGHNDVLARSLENTEYDFVAGRSTGHMDLDGALEAGLAGGLFAVFVPPTESEKRHARTFTDDLSTVGPVPLDRARRIATRMISQLYRYERAADGRFRVARTAGELEGAVAGNHVAALCHLEGAEPVDRDLAALDLFYQAGVRSLGIVWSRTNRFATGVPFGFDRTPDIGEGLTRAGRTLVDRCNELGVLIDVSHLNARGFWDVVRRTKAPIVASHSNAWTLSPSTRNLTDEQLAGLRDVDGLVGINFGTPFLRADGERSEDTPLERLREHVDYIAGHVGIDRVAFGSDFDGVVIPRELGGVRGLPKLIGLLEGAGYRDDEIEKIAYRNWLRVLREVIG